MSHIPFQLPGFEIQQVTGDENRFIITAAAQSSAAICPSCGQNSQRIHSYYIRKPRDLAISGQAVQLNLHVRRFRCQNQDCRRKTFAERLPEVVPWHGQRTSGLTATLTLFAVALSGQAGSRRLEADRGGNQC